MPKYCPRCGAQNPDNAQFCNSCGYNLQSVYSYSPASPPQTPPNPPSWGFPGGYPPPTYAKPLYQQALDLFTRNLGMIIPALLALLLTIIVEVVIGFITVSLLFAGINFLAVRGITFVIGLVVGVIITFLIQVEAYESIDIINGLPLNLQSAWQRTVTNLGSILPTALVVGVIFGLLEFAGVPGAFLVEGLVLILAYVVSSHLASGRVMGLGNALNWYSDSFSREGTSAAVVLIGSVLSVVPILNLFTIPYTALLSTMMARVYP